MPKPSLNQHEKPETPLCKGTWRIFQSCLPVTNTYSGLSCTRMSATYLWLPRACIWGTQSTCVTGCWCFILGSHSLFDYGYMKLVLHTYSCGRVIIGTWSAGEYEIKLDCAWYYPTAHTHVSSVAYVWAIQTQSKCRRITRKQHKIALLAQHKQTSLYMH